MAESPRGLSLLLVYFSGAMLQYRRMKYCVDIFRSLIFDMKLLKKDIVRYTLVYIGVIVLSHVFDVLKSALGISISFSTLIITVLQAVNLILFQQAYTRMKIPVIAFNPIVTVLLHIYMIYFLQMVIFLLPMAAISSFFRMLLPQTFPGRAVIITAAKGGMLLLLGWWLMRLVFLPMILVYKKESMRMRPIVAESHMIVRKHRFIVLPFFLILFLSAVHTAYQVVTGTTANIPLPAAAGLALLLPCSGYVSSLLYCKLVIDYQLEMAQRFLPERTGATV